MTDQEINVVIAEACGWKWFTTKGRDRFRFLAPPNYKEEFGLNHPTTTVEFVTVEIKPNYCGWSYPNYCSDLNAMHEVENCIPDKDWQKFVAYLTGPYWQKTRGMSSDGAYSATAKERAEAFLRTKGLWRDS